MPFLHPSETSVLNRLSKLGSDYIRFTEFIEQHTGHVHQQVGDCWTSGSKRLESNHVVYFLTLESSWYATISNMSFSVLTAGTSHEPTKSDVASWDLFTGFLHRAGLHAAAVQTSPAGPRTRGEKMVLLTGQNTKECKIIGRLLSVSVPWRSTSDNISCELQARSGEGGLTTAESPPV